MNKDPVMTSSLMLRDGVSAHRRMGNRSTRAVGWKNDPCTVIRADLDTSNQQLGHLKGFEWIRNYESLASTPDRTCSKVIVIKIEGSIAEP
jgi:hypothetical protein